MGIVNMVEAINRVVADLRESYEVTASEAVKFVRDTMTQPEDLGDGNQVLREAYREVINATRDDIHRALDIVQGMEQARQEVRRDLDC